MSHKFETELAERLYDDAGHGLADASLGDSCDFGWYALFLANHAIISEDTYGFVSILRFSDESATQESWTILEDSWAEFLAEEPYGFGYLEEEYDSLYSEFESDLYDMED